MKNDLDLSTQLEPLIELYRISPIKALALTINQGASDGVANIKNELTELLPKRSSVDARTAIYTDYICLYTHLMNRALSEKLEYDKSLAVSQTITSEVINDAAKKLHGYNKNLSEQEFVKFLPTRLNSMENVYATATNFAGDSYHDANSIVYLFQNRIFSVFGDKLDFLERTRIIAHLNYSFFLMLIDFSEWVKGPIVELGYKQYKSIKLIDDDRVGRIRRELDQKFPKK